MFALGLGDRLAAVTHGCDFPPEAARLPVITRSTLDDHETRRSLDIHTHISAALHGGSSIYRLDQPLLERLAPDLILTQELCDVCAVSYETVKQAVRRLPGRATILSLEPTTLQGILDTIRRVDEVTGASARAASLVRELEELADTIVVRARAASGRPRVFAMEWLAPPSRPAIGSPSSCGSPAAGMNWPVRDTLRRRCPGVESRSTIPRSLS